MSGGPGEVKQKTLQTTKNCLQRYFLASLGRFELPAFRLGGERSILLSYGNTLFVKVLYTMRFGKSSNFIPRGQFICGKFIFSP